MHKINTAFYVIMSFIMLATLVFSMKRHRLSGKKYKVAVKTLLIATVFMSTFTSWNVYADYSQAKFVEIKESYYNEYFAEHAEEFALKFEYGSKIVIDPIEGFDYVWTPELPKEVGEHKLTYSAKDTDEYMVNFTYLVTIEDTQAPTFDGTFTYEITEGDEFNFEMIEIEASDIVDGSLEYTVTGEYDNATVGTYELTATSKDKNGNETTQTITLTVNEKVVAPVYRAPSSSYTQSSSPSTSASVSGAVASSESVSRTDGFNFNGYHFPIAWFYGGGGELVPADQYVYRYHAITNHYLFEYFGDAGMPVRYLNVGDTFVLDGTTYQIARKESGLVNTDSTAADTLFSQYADITFQTCDTPSRTSTLTIWWAYAV